jgi:glycosyltransferase involved in cell wall biosynthesis
MASQVTPQIWFTCTPVRFPGNKGFFERDSGLLCKGFQAVGVSCRAIMPGPLMHDDCIDDLIRTEYRNLEDPTWWRSQKGEGVVLYAWGAARYFPVARAIRQAGYKLVSHIDSSGTFGILAGPMDYWRALWRIQTALGLTPSSLAIFLAKFFSSFTWSLLKHDWGRARHLRQADLIGAVSPLAAQRIRKACRWYGGEALASRVRLLPHPVGLHMNYASQAKSPRIVAVGRWLPEDWRQKNPFLLMEVMACLLAARSDLECVVVGRMQEEWKAEFLKKVGVHRRRLRLLGQVPNQDLSALLQTTQVALCTSTHESFHIASAEALCCGCSIVAPGLPELPSLRWFTGENSGRLAFPNAMSLAQAVLKELDAWRVKTRSPEAISELWGRRLHADRVAAQIIQDVAMDSDSAQSSRSP